MNALFSVGASLVGVFSVGRTDAGLEEEEEVGITSLTEFLREECVTLYGSYL